MTSTRALIFDLDGVLVDTVELHFRSWKYLAEQHEIAFSWEDMVAFRGRQRRDCLLLLFKNRVLTKAQIENYLEIKNQHYLAQLHAAHPHQLLLPYALQLIEMAVAQGIRVAVASSSVNAVQVLRQVKLYHRLDAIGDGCTVSRSKPAPDIFLWVAGALGIKPAECVVFEDSQAGIHAARECGMTVIGVGQEPYLQQAHFAVPNLGAMPLNKLLQCANQLRFVSESEGARC